MITLLESAAVAALLGSLAMLFTNPSPALATSAVPQSFGELSQVRFLSGTEIVSSKRMTFTRCLEEIATTAEKGTTPARIIIDTGNKRIVEFGQSAQGAPAVFVTCDRLNVRRIINVTNNHPLAVGDA